MITAEKAGLSSEEVKAKQQLYGKNELVSAKKESFFIKTLHILKEPMFLLLIIAATIYFILGEPRDGAIMFVFVIMIISIEIIQEWKTDKTLNALKELAQPQIEVIRDALQQEIASSDLVVGDIMLLSEGIRIPADGHIKALNDLCVDESSLTGESQGIWKSLTDENHEYWQKDYCYAGTFVIQGNATIEVTKIGNETEYGKIGLSIVEAQPEPSPLSKQATKLIKTLTLIASAFFALAIIITYFNLPGYDFFGRLIKSILAGITLAMAMIPEEFPVIFTVFLSMGAWRLAQKSALIKKLPAIETLGAISTLCVDKTGTITKNKMELNESHIVSSFDNLNEIMGLACEFETYDPMEKAMLEYCEKNGYTRDVLFNKTLLEEYSFTNELKMMGHIWQDQERIIIATKGSPESILPLCQLSAEQEQILKDKIMEMAEHGLRVIAVAQQKILTASQIPLSILECTLELCGLVGLADPPRDGIKNNIADCTKAGIRVVMITGDNGITASAIARKIKIPNADKVITGIELEQMSDETLQEKVKKVSIFSRVLPEHKMRIIKAFKSNDEIVAMTGDGVNDAPALKYANIGIAMGKSGSDVSKEAADIILLDDNFATIVSTIKDGRRIYENIKKAVGYVLTIHIPIALAALLAPLLGIHPDNLLLLPVSVVLLELVIDPTCSIVLEREPAEADIMERKPRKINEKLLSKSLLVKSVIQGLVIFIASFGLYYYTLQHSPANVARAIGLTTIIIANIFLVQVISSNYNSIYTSLKSLVKDKVLWIAYLLVVTMLVVVIYSPLNSMFKLAPLTAQQLLSAIIIGLLSVIWYELVKMFRCKKITNLKIA